MRIENPIHMVIMFSFCKTKLGQGTCRVTMIRGTYSLDHSNGQMMENEIHC
jgi:hypothetical protein